MTDPEPTWPVSIKGVVVTSAGVLLARNDRGEWELPGGRLEAGETPETCVAREIAEETGLHVQVGPAIRNWVFEVVPGRHVVVLAYGCRLDDDATPRASEEHTEVRFVALDRLLDVELPDGYRAAVAAWMQCSDPH